uniref:Uncharacterized protein n=1 Tax=Cacopsylla melanoneura TaxID=428564 RepID=A0A8D9BCM5_9HEMI
MKKEKKNKYKIHLKPNTLYVYQNMYVGALPNTLYVCSYITKHPVCVKPVGTLPEYQNIFNLSLQNKHRKISRNNNISGNKTLNLARLIFCPKRKKNMYKKDICQASGRTV